MFKCQTLFSFVFRSKYLLTTAQSIATRESGATRKLSIPEDLMTKHRTCAKACVASVLEREGVWDTGLQTPLWKFYWLHCWKTTPLPWRRTWQVMMTVYPFKRLGHFAFRAWTSKFKLRRKMLLLKSYKHDVYRHLEKNLTWEILQIINGDIKERDSK